MHPVINPQKKEFQSNPQLAFSLSIAVAGDKNASAAEKVINEPMNIIDNLPNATANVANESVNATESQNTAAAIANIVMPSNCSNLRNCVDSCSILQNCSAYPYCIENCTINASTPVKKPHWR